MKEDEANHQQTCTLCGHCFVSANGRCLYAKNFGDAPCDCKCVFPDQETCCAYHAGGGFPYTACKGVRQQEREQAEQLAERVARVLDDEGLLFTRSPRTVSLIASVFAAALSQQNQQWQRTRQAFTDGAEYAAQIVEQLEEQRFGKGAHGISNDLRQRLATTAPPEQETK